MVEGCFMEDVMYATIPFHLLALSSGMSDEEVGQL